MFFRSFLILYILSQSRKGAEETLFVSASHNSPASFAQIRALLRPKFASPNMGTHFRKMGIG